MTIETIKYLQELNRILTFTEVTKTITTKKSKMKQLTKQQILDKTPESNNEVVLQNILHLFSKTKLETFRRMFNELSTHAIYKTQLKQISFGEIHDLLNQAVAVNQQDKQNA